MGTRHTVVAVLLLASAGLTGCQTPPSSAAPPLVICDQTLNDTPSGAVLTDASTRSHVDGVLTSRSAVFIELTASCDKGAQVTFDPADRVTILSRATTKDGRLAAVGVTSPVRATAHITRADGSTSVVTVPAG